MKNLGTLSQLIHRIRGRRVMLSADLAQLYQVAPKALIQAVNRNRDRFPADFLKSKTAIQANISIMRAFVRMRELGAEHREILRKLDDLGLRVDKHDAEIGELIDAIREDMLAPVKSRRQIGFQR